VKIPRSPQILRPLPYAYDAIEPVLSAEAMLIHHVNHQGGYVKKFNKLLKNGGSEEDLEFNYSAHILHTLYFNNLASPHSTHPGPKFLASFPSAENCLLEMLQEASNIKGSGWALLVEDNKGLSIKSIPNHELGRVVNKCKPILVLDLWEHAWYLDYQSDKADFLESIKSCINWDKVESRLAQV